MLYVSVLTKDAFKEKQHSKSPTRIVSVSHQKRKSHLDSVEYKVKNYSKVLVAKNLAFPWVEMPGKECEATVMEILNSSVLGDIVLLKAKVVSKGDSENVFSSRMQRELTKCDIVLADTSGSIQTVIWEEMISRISEGESYVFTNFKVNYFNNKHLSGSSNLAAVSCEDIILSPQCLGNVEQLKPRVKEIQNINGRILAVDITKSYVCVNCDIRIVPEDIGANSQFVDCSTCKLSMLKNDVSSTASGNIVIVDERGQNMGRFKCACAVLNAMFTSISNTQNYNMDETDVAKLSRKIIMNTLLLIKKVSFQVSHFS